MRVQSNNVGAPLAGGLQADARFSWRIGLYHPTWRARVAAVAAHHPALADLAESFPALLFALTSGNGSASKRAAAIEAILAGESLQHTADILGLAWWTRKPPASAFREPLPPFPIDADFSRRMASLVPDGVNTCALWLTAVCEAVPAGGRQYALWTARHGVALVGTLSEAQRQAFHAWVWMGWHPGTSGHALVRRPWASDLGIKKVMEEFGAFLGRVALADALGDGKIGGVISDLHVHGLTFRPLRSAFDYINAAAALDNCLEQYADRLHRGTCAVATISDGPNIIGCVEIGPHPTESAMPAIVQLRVAKNKRASAALWSAAYAWLAACDMRPLMPHALAPSEAEKLRTRSSLWNAYLADLAASPGGSGFHERARAALSGDPPSLDTPSLTRHVHVRATPWPHCDAPPMAAHMTLFERLANIAARGTIRRIGRDV
jgi:hypothetical protein